jgi:hypothetical protein
MDFFANLFGGGIVKSIENLASEWITTDMESAEAKAVMIKTIDPNGKMRRDLSKFACVAYGFYLVTMTLIGFMVAFNVGDSGGAKAAMTMMGGLFTPITTSWGLIVGASFGVNGVNSAKGR